MHHLRKTHKRYKSYGPSQGCDFCDAEHTAPRIVQELEHAYVIPNRTFYDVWEMRRVTDHLLIIPKRHVLHLSQLSKAERADIINAMAQYEAEGYQIYARSPDSGARSVPHQHTHLIKTDNRPGRALLFLRRPYILWRLR